MRSLAAIFAVMCLAAACRTMPDLSRHQTPTPQPAVAQASCPDGLPQQPGLTGFGAYIGTWQANHQRLPQSADYAFATGSGRVGVRCSESDYVVGESITWKFRVPSGRALQFALTDLPADSVKVYDHAHADCRTLQYRSAELAAQLARDDRLGLADITIQGAGVDLRVATALGDDARPCLSL